MVALHLSLQPFAPFAANLSGGPGSLVAGGRRTEARRHTPKVLTKLPHRRVRVLRTTGGNTERSLPLAFCKPSPSFAGRNYYRVLSC